MTAFMFQPIMNNKGNIKEPIKIQLSWQYNENDSQKKSVCTRYEHPSTLPRHDFANVDQTKK
jgi:hypothetical protein